MAQPTTQLNATEQDTLVKQIGLALLRAAPRDWRRVTAEYRAVGRYHEMTGEIINEDGTAQEWVATHDIATLFGRLRGGMYRDGRGTWFNARYQLDHPSSYNLEYNRDEPKWDLIPPPQAYSDELRMFPRSEDNVPEWLIRRMSGLAPEQPGQPRFRIARIFDTVGPAGRPVINRPDLEVEEQDRLLEYLDSAKLVVSDRGYDVDRLAATPEPTVPVAFHSDGLWIWPAAVNFYLRQYGVSPEPDLVEHVRAMGFKQPEVEEQTLQAAAAYLQPPRPAGPPPLPPLQGSAPPPGPPAPMAPQAPVQQAQQAQAPQAPAQQIQQVQQQAPPPPPPTAVVLPVAEEQAAPEPEAEPEPEEEQRPKTDPAFDELEQTQFHDRTEFADAFGDDPFDDDHDLDHDPDHGVDHGLDHNADHGIDHNVDHNPDRNERFDNTAQYDNQAQFAAEPEFEEETPEPVSHAMGTNGVEQNVEQPTIYTPAPVIDPGPLTMVTPPSGAPIPPRPEPKAYTPPSPVVEDPTEPSRSQYVPPQPPSAPEPAEPHAPALERLQAKLDELDIPDDIYRIGEPAEHGWSVEQVDSGWRVGWYDGELANPAVFGDAEDAAAFMLGKLLLLPHGGTEEVPEAEPEPEPEVETPRAPVMATLSPEQATGFAPNRNLEQQPEPIRGERDLEGAAMMAPPARNFAPQQQGQQGQPGQVQQAPPPQQQQPPQAPPQLPPRREPPPPAPTVAVPMPSGPIPAQSPPQRRAEPVRAQQQGSPDKRQAPGNNQQWPIYPMTGEPPLTLFRGKELRELPAGSELDRFGGANGNLTYAAGTPFEERSLVPEWANRPYHVYRVQRPIESLAGIAIPWFDQPGGGSAYLLPASIEELVASGDLLELDPGEPPID